MEHIRRLLLLSLSLFTYYKPNKIILEKFDQFGNLANIKSNA